MTLAARAKALAFWKFALQSRVGYFGTLLNLHPVEFGGSLEIRETTDEMSCVSVRIPRWCCDPHDGRVRLSALIAMLDEVSTYCGTCIWDRSMRPGVSIQLSARAATPQLDLGEDDVAVIETRLQKIGRTLGFVGVTVKTETGKELVQARHIKFMPMGAVFDLFLHPAVQGYSVPLWHRLVLDRQPLHQVPSFPDRIEELFGMERSKDSPLNSTLHVERQHGNPIGSIHGGCGVMATSYSAALALQDTGRTATTHPLSIQTNLLAGVPTTKRRRTDLATEIFPGEQVHTRTLLSTPEGPAIETDIRWQS